MSNVTFFIPDLGVGGAERVLSVIANNLSRDINYNIQICLLDDDKVEYPISKGIDVCFLSYNKKNINPFRTIERVINIRKALKNNNTDIAISFLTSANMLVTMACLFSKTRLIISERSDPSKNCPNKLIARIRNFLYLFCDGLVCQTEEAKKYFPTKIQKKAYIIVNPIKPGLPVKTNNIFEKNIIAVTRLQKSKNLELLLFAFSKIIVDYPDFILKIYGEGPEKKHLKTICEELQIANNVCFLGNDINWHNKCINATAFVLTSNYEGMSNSLIEAMAMGLPVISTDHPVGGARYFIKSNHNGILIPVNDEKMLVLFLKKVIEQKDYRINLGNEAKKIISIVDEEKICKKWREYINFIIGGTRYDK